MLYIPIQNSELEYVILYNSAMICCAICLRLLVVEVRRPNRNLHQETRVRYVVWHSVP